MQPIRSHREGTPARPAHSGCVDPRAPDAPVYPPREDTRLLLPFAEVPRGTLLLEVGTGSGLVALAAARRGARVVATDLNPHALRRLRARAREEGVDLALVRTDLAHGLGRFDRILANPPYLPTRPESATRTGGTTWPWMGVRTAVGSPPAWWTSSTSISLVAGAPLS